MSAILRLIRRALLRTVLIALVNRRWRRRVFAFGRSNRKSTPSLGDSRSTRARRSTLIYDSKDRLISALYKEHRIPVTLEEMSEPLVAAVLATEDRRFYEHHGVDAAASAASMVANLRRGRIVQGGSTITQQFVRGAFLDRSKTYGRKIREAWLAHRLEVEVQQARDSTGVSQPRLSRRRLLRRAGRVAGLLRQAGSELMLPRRRRWRR